MDPIHRKTLQKLRAELKKSLEVDALWDELVARSVFSEDMVDEFKVKDTGRAGLPAFILLPTTPNSWG
jgi:hypothetical protein